jgi:hypothetical protein
MADFDSPFDTLAILAEVVSSDDEMLSLGKRTVDRNCFFFCIRKVQLDLGKIFA